MNINVDAVGVTIIVDNVSNGKQNVTCSKVTNIVTQLVT